MKRPTCILVALLTSVFSALATEPERVLISTVKGEDHRILYISWDEIVPGGPENSNPPHMTALDLASGEALWHIRDQHPLAGLNEDRSQLRFLMSRNLILAVENSDRIDTIALGAAEGELRWHVEETGWAFDIDGAILTDSGQGLDPKTGEKLWEIESWKVAGPNFGLQRQIDADAERGEFVVARENENGGSSLHVTIYSLRNGATLRKVEVPFEPGRGPLGGFAGVHHRGDRTVVKTFQKGRTILHVYDIPHEEPRRYAANKTHLVRRHSPYPWLYWDRDAHGICGWLDVRTGERHATETIRSMLPDPRSDSAVLVRYWERDGLYRLDPASGDRQRVLDRIGGVRDGYSLSGFDGDARIAYSDFFALACVDLGMGRTVWARKARRGGRPYLYWYNADLSGAFYQDGEIELYDPATGAFIEKRRIQ